VLVSQGVVVHTRVRRNVLRAVRFSQYAHTPVTQGWSHGFSACAPPPLLGGRFPPPSEPLLTGIREEFPVCNCHSIPLFPTTILKGSQAGKLGASSPEPKVHVPLTSQVWAHLSSPSCSPRSGEAAVEALTGQGCTVRVMMDTSRHQCSCWSLGCPGAML
jgi:hypothetical protein